jgi:hypothetical protein
VTDERPPVLRGEVQEPGGGPTPGNGRGPGGFRFEARSWTWSDQEVRRGLPWFGVFLVVFGAILLVGQTYPRAHILGSALTTAFGLAFLVSWATGRRWGLYPGLLITAYSLPGLLVDLTLLPAGSGYGAFLFGIGLLGVAAMRYGSRRTWGWQLVIGAILALAGGSEIGTRLWPGFPSLGNLLGPLVLVLLGLVILSRGVRRGAQPRGR